MPLPSTSLELVSPVPTDLWCTDDEQAILQTLAARAHMAASLDMPPASSPLSALSALIAASSVSSAPSGMTALSDPLGSLYRQAVAIEHLSKVFRLARVVQGSGAGMGVTSENGRGIYGIGTLTLTSENGRGIYGRGIGDTNPDPNPDRTPTSSGGSREALGALDMSDLWITEEEADTLRRLSSLASARTRPIPNPNPNRSALSAAPSPAAPGSGPATVLIRNEKGSAYSLKVVPAGGSQAQGAGAGAGSLAFTFSNPATSSSPASFVAAATTSLPLVTARQLKMSAYMAAWFGLSGLYNIYNKKALTLLPASTWTIGAMQMWLGMAVIFPLWLLRIREFPIPDLAAARLVARDMLSVGLFQTATHGAGVTSLGSGPVSFVQVIKASEPAFTSALQAALQRKFIKPGQALSLLPVMCGVVLATVSEIEFSAKCLVAGLVANVFASLRGIYGKEQMCSKDGTRCVEMSPQNYYSLLTLVSSVLLVPIVCALEGGPRRAWGAVRSSKEGFRATVISGLLFYLYNEMSFVCLGMASPVAHALMNTMKRVVIILSSVVFFGNKLTPLGWLGAAVSVGGVFVYSALGQQGQAEAQAGGAKP